jgi:hypothetical protein
MEAGLKGLSDRKKLFEKLLIILIVLCFSTVDFIFFRNASNSDQGINHMISRLSGLGTLLTIALIGFHLLNIPRSVYYYVFAGFLILYLLNIYTVVVSPNYNSADKLAYQEILLGLFRSLVWIAGGITLVAEGGRGVNKSEIFKIFSISFGAFICVNMLDQYSYLLFDNDPYQYIRYLCYVFMPMIFMIIFILNKNLRNEYSEAAVKLINFMFLLFSLTTITFLINFLFYES